MEDITEETVAAAITTADPVLEALSILLREVSADAVHMLASVLTSVRQDPADMPGEFLIQAVLVESEKVFRPISRDSWIQVYDAYHKVKAVIDANPDLAAAVREHGKRQDERLSSPEDVADALLDGNF